MSSNIATKITELANLKQLDRESIRTIIEESIMTAINKKLKPENDLRVICDFDTNYIAICFNKLVVENDDSLGQISYGEARQSNSHIQLGDLIPVEIPLQNLEPKVIKIAREEILRRIKKLEEDRKMFDFEKQKNQIVYGKVRKQDYNGYVIDIGFADALLPIEEQMQNEYYKIGDFVRAYVLNIRKKGNDLVVILSRAHPEFVKKLFEMEIPEIANGDLEIKKIIRDPGVHCKVAIDIKNKSIDALGSCIGPKAVRLEQIRKELHGEQIDIVIWDEVPETLIKNAIGVDLIEQVYIAEKGKFARVIVNEKNKSLAIGNLGKNVKLAAKLTDYKLDIYTLEEFEDKISEERRITSHVTELDGVTLKIADILKEHAYTSVQDIYEASVKELCEIEGIGEKTAIKIKEAAERF